MARINLAIFILGTMRHIIFIAFAFCVLSASAAFADKIYLKSGEVLEGKIKVKSEGDRFLWENWCGDQKFSIVSNEQSSRCVETANIERVEKEFKAPEGVQLLAKSDLWGEEKYGYQTQLIPMNEKYVVGEPMKFSLVMRNVSGTLKWYDSQGLFRVPFVVKKSDGKEVYKKTAPVQTVGSERPLDTDEIVTLFEDVDISNDFVITEPGAYTIQFQEGSYGMDADGWFPASNTVEFEALSGKPKMEDVLIEKLSEIPPKEWYLVGANWDRPSDASALPPEIGFVTHAIDKGRYIYLWRTDHPIDISSINSGMPWEKTTGYLGQADLGHFYIEIPTDAEHLWPTFREDIKKALAIQG